jgi:multidrug efflux pump
VFSTFFIARPIFATVLSILITLVGGVALVTLPVAQYPEITPPTVEVSATYPGANAKVVVDTVAAPIEQQLNGVEGMLYMSSVATNDGNYSLTVTFKPGTNLNIAQVLVQNRVSLAQPVLPDLVKRRGIAVKKKSPSILMIVNLYSPDGSRDSLYLSNYATIQLRDELSRLPGIGDITYLGQRDYSMRLWLDPQKMAARRLSASDIVKAIEQQNIQVAVGQIGQPPVPSGQVFQYTMTTLGRLADVEQFADMVLRSDEDGRIIRMRDVARIELGALGYDQSCTLDGRPSVALSVYQLPGSNALETARLVRDKMAQLRTQFPEGLDYAIVYDTTPFIEESINGVFHTLRDAIVLVAVVVLLFLQNWRSALIPLVAVPVSLIGTFAVMAALGFSLNNLTLFGLVLAIGIVVDDAIVVVEAVEHHLERGLAPRQAAEQAMRDVSGPVIAIGLVLCAVFVPCAFLGGISGQFYRQFALTIAVSTAISAFNSLTLSPALAAILLKRRDDRPPEPLPRLTWPLAGAGVGWWLAQQPAVRDLVPDVPAWGVGLAAAVLLALLGRLIARLANAALAWGFTRFEHGLATVTTAYLWLVRRCLQLCGLVLLAYVGLIGLTGWLFTQTPKGFIPTQDKGYLLVNLQLPEAASVERTRLVTEQVERLALSVPGVSRTVAISGQSLLLNANAPNFGSLLVILDDFEHRRSPDRSSEAISAVLRQRLAEEIEEAVVEVFGAPPIEGLGTAGGFKLVIEDRSDLGTLQLQQAADQLAQRASEQPEFRGIAAPFQANTPWLYLDIDRAQAKSLGVPTSEIFNTLQVFLGSYYVNDFNRFGRTWQVNVQADPEYRKRISDLRQLQVRNESGGIVPLGTLTRVREINGPAFLMRYNLYAAATVSGEAAPGISSGQAIARMDELAKEALPATMRAEWTELALLELQAGGTAGIVFILAVVLVFLVLAAQYESWSLPLAVILVVPMCLLCSLIGVLLAGQDVNIFTQVGLVVLVGLACKNAILIVEYARARRLAGLSISEATLTACQLRLRPILMTSFAFILGVVPLMLSEGAGAEMRRVLGTAVFSGMLGVTLFGIFLTPVFFQVIQWATEQLVARFRRG